jgi:hypothetical protein
MNMYIEDNWMTFDPEKVMCTLRGDSPQRESAPASTEFIHNALRAADEAQAEGLQELSIARINLVYHLFEDLVG